MYVHYFIRVSWQGGEYFFMYIKIEFSTFTVFFFIKKIIHKSIKPKRSYVHNQIDRETVQYEGLLKMRTYICSKKSYVVQWRTFLGSSWAGEYSG